VLNINLTLKTKQYTEIISKNRQKETKEAVIWLQLGFDFDSTAVRLLMKSN